MFVVPVMFEPVARLVSALAVQPAATLTTLLYHANLLPADLKVKLDRLVRRDLLNDPHNDFLFRVLANMAQCIW